VVAALGAALPAGAAIVPGRAIDGISLRMSEAQVRARLGAPLHVYRWVAAHGRHVAQLHYASLDVVVQSLGNRPVVVLVLTRRPSDRTASGVGVGSTLASVEKLPNARCALVTKTQRYCGVTEPGKPFDRYTLFWAGRGDRVTEVFVQLVVV